MKLKTVKSAKKRIIKITKKGKVIRRELSAQHLVAGKSKRTLKKSSRQKLVSSADARKIKKMVPYDN